MAGSVQGWLREDKKAYAFFLDLQKAYDLWGVMVYGIHCGTCVNGRMWHVIKRMYEASRSAVLLEGKN